MRYDQYYSAGYGQPGVPFIPNKMHIHATNQFGFPSQNSPAKLVVYEKVGEGILGFGFTKRAELDFIPGKMTYDSTTVAVIDKDNVGALMSVWEQMNGCWTQMFFGGVGTPDDPVDYLMWTNDGSWAIAAWITYK
jgi:hypothetical protein